MFTSPWHDRNWPYLKKKDVALVWCSSHNDFLNFTYITLVTVYNVRAILTYIWKRSNFLRENAIFFLCNMLLHSKYLLFPISIGKKSHISKNLIQEYIRIKLSFPVPFIFRSFNFNKKLHPEYNTKLSDGVEYPFITITPMSTLTRNGRAYLSPV